ncbi:unnamed protein product [Dimorphilus gyrociliatus]|uniref:Uncharacterized protein n=1 Tax=Dimorphilus gyrociliatus TaxID=2664684 RepID=A0A7I8W3X3_9ANNE|nr:unnamed protein product [Dimorphilus gyrociliatus]
MFQKNEVMNHSQEKNSSCFNELEYFEQSNSGSLQRKKKFLNECGKLLSKLPETVLDSRKCRYKIPKEWSPKSEKEIKNIKMQTKSAKEEEREDNTIKIDFDNSTTLCLNIKLTDNLQCLADAIIKVFEEYNKIKKERLDENDTLNNEEKLSDTCKDTTLSADRGRNETSSSPNRSHKESQNKNSHSMQLEAVPEISSDSRNDFRTMDSRNQGIYESSKKTTSYYSNSKDGSSGQRSRSIRMENELTSMKSAKQLEPNYANEDLEKVQPHTLRNSDLIQKFSSYCYDSSSAAPDNEEEYDRLSKTKNLENEVRSNPSQYSYTENSTCDTSTNETLENSKYQKPALTSVNRPLNREYISEDLNKKKAGNTDLSSENINACNSSTPFKKSRFGKNQIPRTRENSPIQCFQIDNISNLNHSTLSHVMDKLNDSYAQFDKNQDYIHAYSDKPFECDDIYTLEKNPSDYSDDIEDEQDCFEQSESERRRLKCHKLPKMFKDEERRHHKTFSRRSKKLERVGKSSPENVIEFDLYDNFSAGNCHPQCPSQGCILEKIKQELQRPTEKKTKQGHSTPSYLSTADKEFQSHLKQTVRKRINMTN